MRLITLVIVACGLLVALVGCSSAPAEFEPVEDVAGNDDTVSTPEPTVTEEPTATEAAEPAPTETAPPEPVETPDPREIALAEARASNAWLQLAEYERATIGVREFLWHSTGPTDDGCAYGDWTNAEEVWNDFAPQLREEMLQLAVDEGIEPTRTRYPDTEFESGFGSGILVWWTNEAAPEQGYSGGTGQTYIAQASYRTADGEARIRQWPVLIGHAETPEESREAYLREIGPAQDLAVAEVDFSNGYTSANEQFNDHHLPWLEALPDILEPVDPPLPPGC